MNTTHINITKHIKCGEAIEEYTRLPELPVENVEQLTSCQKQWLSKYEDLFYSCIIKPSGLPWIHRSGSNHYFNIKDFANMYDEVYKKIK